MNAQKRKNHPFCNSKTHFFCLTLGKNVFFCVSWWQFIEMIVIIIWINMIHIETTVCAVFFRFRIPINCYSHRRVPFTFFLRSDSTPCVQCDHKNNKKTKFFLSTFINFVSMNSPVWIYLHHQQFNTIDLYGFIGLVMQFNNGWCAENSCSSRKKILNFMSALNWNAQRTTKKNWLKVFSTSQSSPFTRYLKSNKLTSIEQQIFRNLFSHIKNGFLFRFPLNIFIHRFILQFSRQ